MPRLSGFAKWKHQILRRDLRDEECFLPSEDCPFLLLVPEVEEKRKSDVFLPCKTIISLAIKLYIGGDTVYLFRLVHFLLDLFFS